MDLEKKLQKIKEDEKLFFPGVKKAASALLIAPWAECEISKIRELKERFDSLLGMNKFTLENTLSASGIICLDDYEFSVLTDIIKQGQQKMINDLQNHKEIMGG